MSEPRKITEIYRMQKEIPLSSWNCRSLLRDNSTQWDLLYHNKKVSTVFSEINEKDMVSAAIRNDSETTPKVFYLGKKRAQQVAGLGVHEHANSLPDELIHKITDAGSPVKPIITSQTDTMQFKRWFGNSVMTENGKAQGKPRVFYHGTNSGGFTVFDKNMIVETSLQWERAR